MEGAPGVQEYYQDRSVFITGATGFLGKTLLEKLVRSCPTIKNVYVLLRAKGGQYSRQRLQELLNSIVFEKIQRENPCLLNKIIPVSGDITYPGLGISPMDLRTLQENVSIVFHSAATIRFDEPLKRAVDINVSGTNKVLELAKSLHNLEALIHVSTAYCTIDKGDVDELVNIEPVPPKKIIDATSWMSDELLASLSAQLYNGRPSSYHYTKALAENLLVQAQNMPIGIVRPSIITASFKDPLPGWIDNYNGPTGYFVVSGKGVLRSMLVDKKKICDMVPVDFVANTVICSAWYIGLKKLKDAQIFNCTSGGLNPITWGELKDISEPILIQNPSMELFRYPGAKFHSSRLIHQIHLNIEHNVPAYFVDFLFRITGHKPILVQVYQKVHRAIAALEYFTINEWTFQNHNMVKLISSIHEEDRENFTIDPRQINWKNYLEIYILGVRNFLLKEDPSTLPLARKRLQRIYYATQFAKILVVSGLIHQLTVNRELIKKFLRR